MGFLGFTTSELELDPALLLSSLEEEEDPLLEPLEPESLSPSLEPASDTDLGVDLCFDFGVDFGVELCK